MLEVILVVFLSKKLGAILEEKGRKKTGFIIMFILLWIFCEIVGGAIGGITMGQENLMAVYFYALMGAGLATLISFLIVKNLKPIVINEDGRTMVEGRK